MLVVGVGRIILFPTESKIIAEFSAELSPSFRGRCVYLSEESSPGKAHDV